ncbi:hypothetical protein [Pacificitalea manganoxidans]|uniref:hypothetical protein n=1 Tax=Pacificitalea manganoxidans TaxID=1411902 RepID=UPI0018E0A19F|nr:hypothetical protein [Pacificitalea manganoxidans]MDR6309263.1 hypothetical protein [Pacificitalea manganoxidans]
MSRLLRITKAEDDRDHIPLIVLSASNHEVSLGETALRRLPQATLNIGRSYGRHNAGSTA